VRAISSRDLRKNCVPVNFIRFSSSIFEPVWMQSRVSCGPASAALT
jgi:hypothetical protein